MSLHYMSGFGNSFETEALPGALPVGQNSPQHPPYGLYAEQVSGSSFTTPRHVNRRSWLYRIRPSVKHGGHFKAIDTADIRTAPNSTEATLPIGQMRWSPSPVPDRAGTFVDSLHTVTTCGDAETQSGMAAHLLLIRQTMIDCYFQNADGEFLIVAQQGNLRFHTELGIVDIQPGEICVIPRGIIFRLELTDGPACAYICENYGLPFMLPERGPIGANGLASERDFQTPVAAWEDKDCKGKLYTKWCGGLYLAEIDHSPLDVVAWHGNHAPYKYDLRRFSPMGALRVDHADPSIFTVLTSPSDISGTANVDFAIFPERWAVSENTFRPPWYHRNIMSEFMGLIYGIYDAKPSGFQPGGMSLHNMMMPHGPDTEAFEKATQAKLAPVRLENTLAFMFETRFPQRITRYAAELPTRQDDYIDCWSNLPKRFDPKNKGL
jgi:homogentisate 1,2-dioxygenase